MPRIKRERNPKVKTPWDGVFSERADELLSGGVDPKAKAAESNITDVCYLHHKKETGLEGERAEGCRQHFVKFFVQLCNKNATILLHAESLFIDKTKAVVSQTFC